MSRIKSTKFYLLAFSLVCAVMSSHAFAASDVDCDIDDMMKDNRIALDKMTTGIYERTMGKAIESAPTVKDASCLPILDTLDSLIRLRIPSIGGAMGGLLAKIRDMACKAANGFLEQLASKATYNISDPLGVVSAGVGLDNGAGGTQIEQYDMGEIVEKAATDAITGAGSGKVQGKVNEVLNKMPSGPADRIPRPENTIRNEINGAINGL